MLAVISFTPFTCSRPKIMLLIAVHPMLLVHAVKRIGMVQPHPLCCSVDVFATPLAAVGVKSNNSCRASCWTPCQGAAPQHMGFTTQCVAPYVLTPSAMCQTCSGAARRSHPRGEYRSRHVPLAVCSHCSAKADPSHRLTRCWAALVYGTNSIQEPCNTCTENTYTLTRTPGRVWRHAAQCYNMHNNVRDQQATSAPGGYTRCTLGRFWSGTLLMPCGDLGLWFWHAAGQFYSRPSTPHTCP